MDCLSQFPPELFSYIFSSDQADVKNIKNWDQKDKSLLASLFESYSCQESLKSYVVKANKKFDKGDLDSLNIQKVKFVFQEVMQQAAQMDYPEESPSLEALSAGHLENVINWTKAKEEEIRNFDLFVSKIHCLAFATFVHSIPKDLSPSKRGEEIRQWMKNNVIILDRVTILDGSQLKLTAIPKEIQYLRCLQRVALQNNAISTLPREIQFLTNLESLVLTNNALTSLCSEIGFLKRLERLYLVGNQLKNLPDEMALMDNLESLSVSKNRLSAVPKWLEKLPKLDSLNLGENDIKTFPSKIGHLKHQGNGRYSSEE